MSYNWVRISVFATFAAFLAIALIALQSPQTTSATEFNPAPPTILFVESDSECGTDTADDNGNGLVNEGCPLIGSNAESGSECLNNTNDDPTDDSGTDVAVNDGCPGVPRVGTSQTPDTTALFDIPAPSAQFSSATAFTDPDFTVAAGGSGGAMDIGAIVGLVDSTATLGLVNGPCSTVIPVPISMMNASTDTSDTIAVDGPPDNLLLPLAEDANSDDLPDVVNKYPAYLNTIFDRGDGTPLTPRFRYAGVQDVAGLIVILNLVGFDTGELRKLPGGGPAIPSLGTGVVTVLQDPTLAASNSAISDFCANLSTDVDLLGVSNDNACTITTTTGCSLDVATSLGTRTIFKGVNGGDSGGESGATRLTGPTGAGTRTSTQMYASQRDFDGDDIENGLDACNFTDSGAFDPRAATNPTTDADTDGLDASCDPLDSIIGGLNTDQDGDAYLNRLDNCALIPNGDTKVAVATNTGTSITVDSTAGFAVGNDIQISAGTAAERRTITSKASGPPRFNFAVALSSSHLIGDPVAQVFLPNSNFGQADTDILFPIPVPDGGPRADAIGPACDSGVTIDGETLSPTLPNGHFHRTATISRGCVLGTDADGDGVCAGFIQIPVIGSVESDCTDGVDNDGDGAAGDGCAEDDTTSDTDGDGVPDGLDNCLNTDNAASAGFTQADVDADGIGDACETVNDIINTNDNDGDGFSNTLEGVDSPVGSLSSVTFKAGHIESECGNDSDDDGDGKVNDGCPAWGAAETACSDAVDSDRDLYVNDGCPVENVAEGSAGVSTGVELHCARNSLDTVGSFPPDIDGDAAITAGDLSLIAGAIGTATVAGGGTTSDRLDIGPEPVSDNQIGVTDLIRVAAVIGTGC